MNNETNNEIKGERFEKSPIVVPSESPFFETNDFEFVYVPKQKKKSEESTTYYYPLS